MIIILILLALFIGGMFLANSNSDYDEIGIITAFVSGVFLATSLIVLPIFHMSTVSEIQEFHSVQSTLNNARESSVEIESAAFQIKVAESNAWLARCKYWNGTIFDIYVPDEVEDLQPIK